MMVGRVSHSPVCSRRVWLSSPHWGMIHYQIQSDSPLPFLYKQKHRRVAVLLLVVEVGRVSSRPRRARSGRALRLHRSLIHYPPVRIHSLCICQQKSTRKGCFFVQSELAEKMSLYFCCATRVFRLQVNERFSALPDFTRQASTTCSARLTTPTDTSN